MAKLKLKDKQVTGNVGLYYISYRLSRMGWNVMPTSRNAKGIDILAYGKDGEIFHTIQTKGYTKIAAVGTFKKETEVIPEICSTLDLPGILRLEKAKSTRIRVGSAFINALNRLILKKIDRRSGFHLFYP